MEIKNQGNIQEAIDISREQLLIVNQEQKRVDVQSRIEELEKLIRQKSYRPAEFSDPGVRHSNIRQAAIREQRDGMIDFTCQSAACTIL